MGKVRQLVNKRIRSQTLAAWFQTKINKYVNKIKGIIVSSNDKFIEVPLEKPIKFFLISLKALW